MSNIIKESESENKTDPKDSTSGLPQPFKFFGEILVNNLSERGDWVKTVVVFLFVILMLIFGLASLKGLTGVDFFQFLNSSDNIFYYSFSGDVVMKGTNTWTPINSSIEFTSAKILYTRKEFMNMGYYRIFWIIRFPNNELETGEIDLSVTIKNNYGKDELIATSLKKYSDLFDASNPYRWVHFIIDTTLTDDKIQVVMK
jgi:hypothetical protein